MSTQSKITAGKWGIQYYSPEHKGQLPMMYIASDRQPINSNLCLIGRDYENNPETMANAQAIAAVPEMIEALLKMRKAAEAQYNWHKKQKGDVVERAYWQNSIIPIIDEALRKAGQL